MVADSFTEQVCFQMSAKRCQGVCFPTYLRSFYTFSVMVVCAAGRICLIALGPAAGLNDHQHPLKLANLFLLECFKCSCMQRLSSSSETLIGCKFCTVSLHP